MKIIERLKKNNFLSSILLISGGTALAQILSVLGSPIITRLYSTEEYGVLTMYIAFISVISSVGALKYEWAIPISEDEKEASQVLVLSLSIITIITILGFSFLFLFNDLIFGLVTSEALASYSFFIPIGYFFTSLYIVLSQWALREKNYLALSQTKIIQSFIQNFIKIGAGLLKLGPAGLIIGNILGQSSGILRLSGGIKKILISITKVAGLNEIKYVAKKYRKYPMYSAPSQILNTLGLQLPTILLSVLYGVEVIGYYGLANSVVSLPMTFIGNSVADVFYAEIASSKNKDNQKIKRLSLSLVKKLILIGLIPLIFLLFFGEFLFVFVYGSGWEMAGQYAQILAFLVYARFVFTPLSRVYQVFQRQKEAFILDALRVIIVLVTFVIASYFNLNSSLFLIIYTIGMSILYFISYIGTLIILEKNV